MTFYIPKVILPSQKYLHHDLYVAYFSRERVIAATNSPSSSKENFIPKIIGAAAKIFIQNLLGLIIRNRKVLTYLLTLASRYQSPKVWFLVNFLDFCDHGFKLCVDP